MFFCRRSSENELRGVKGCICCATRMQLLRRASTLIDTSLTGQELRALMMYLSPGHLKCTYKFHLHRIHFRCSLYTNMKSTLTLMHAKLKLPKYFFDPSNIASHTKTYHSIIRDVASITGQDEKMLTEAKIRRAFFKYCDRIAQLDADQAQLMRSEATKWDSRLAFDKSGIIKAESEWHKVRSITPRRFDPCVSTYEKFMIALEKENPGVELEKTDFDRGLGSIESDLVRMNKRSHKHAEQSEAMKRIRREGERYWASRFKKGVEEKVVGSE